MNDFSDPIIDIDKNITMHFKWREALWHQVWQSYIFPNDDQRYHIIQVALKLEAIRKVFHGKPIKIRSWLRQPVYNFSIGGAPHSMHMKGGAVDFTVQDVSPSMVRETLKDKLELLGIRMERLHVTATWTHIDIREPGPSGRYFVP